MAEGTEEVDGLDGVFRTETLCVGADALIRIPYVEGEGKELLEATGGFEENDGDVVLVREAGCRSEVGEVVGADPLQIAVARN